MSWDRQEHRMDDGRIWNFCRHDDGRSARDVDIIVRSTTRIPIWHERVTGSG